MASLAQYLLDNEPAFTKSRLRSLYSDFGRDKRIDPDNYNANVQDWKTALFHAARAGRLPSSDGDKSTSDMLSIEVGEPLLRSLDFPPWGRPECLHIVFQEAGSHGDVFPLQEYLNATQSIRSRSWFQIPPPAEIASWAWKQVGLANLFSGLDSENQTFVCLENVENMTASVKSYCSTLPSSPSARIFSRDIFLDEMSRIHGSKLSTIDGKILLTYLSRDDPILAYDASNDTVKIISDSKYTKVTEDDASIANIKRLVASLETSTEKLEGRVFVLDRAARAAVSRKDTVTARNILRRKKALADTLEKRRSNHAQLEGILLSIDTAHDSATMIKAMSQSAIVLKRLNSEIGGIENVDKVTDRLREEMEQADEINNTVTEFGRENTVLDEDEIDAEFEKMQQQASRAEDEKVKADQESKHAEKTRERLQVLNQGHQTQVEDRMEVESPAPIVNASASKTPAVPTEEELKQSLERLKALHIGHDTADKVAMTN